LGAAQELTRKVNVAAEEKRHTDETFTKLQARVTLLQYFCAIFLCFWAHVRVFANILQEVMMQKDTQYKAVKDNESKLLSLIEMFKKQLKEIEKNSEEKEKKLRYLFPRAFL
jgi:hypothetical protein